MCTSKDICYGDFQTSNALGSLIPICSRIVKLY